MEIDKVQHITRYNIFHNNQHYIRLHEIDILDEENISWYIVNDEQLSILNDIFVEKLETKFIELID